MKVLVIGSGGREHAIIKKFKESKIVTSLFCAPGNAGMKKDCTIIDIKVTDIDALLSFAKEENIDFTVVGPEVPLSLGIVDAFMKAGLKIFGPSKKASRIESSKDFAKNLMKKYRVPTAAYETFTDCEKAKEYVREKGAPIVIKYDGLAAGKGVTVAMDEENAFLAIDAMLKDDIYGEGKAVIEEYLEGPEFSFMCFVNGENVYPLALSQDHKRAFDFDQGANTGGMGAYSPLPFISKEDEAYALEHIMKPVASAMVKEGCPFTGVLYGGLMKTKDGIKVIEFNCRFGDPETEVILTRLDSDLLQAMLDTLDNRKPVLSWSDEAALGIVLASKGYPGSYEKGYEIKNLDKVDGNVFYMGVKMNDGKIVTDSGRVLMVVVKGKDLAFCQKKALEEVKKIECENLFYRSDIGHYAIEGK